MPIPPFILELRRDVGHALLWLTGVTGVVLDADGRVLLVRRADTGEWGLTSGILEPGEQPAPAVVREVEEETGVVAAVEGLASVWTMPPMRYPNGDRSQYLDLCFRCRYVEGEARVGDDESVEVGWFPVDGLPELPAGVRARLERALAFDGRTWFAGAGTIGA